MRNIIKKKRGAFTDIFIFIIMAFTIVLISGIFIYLGNTTQTKLHESLDNRSTSAINYTQKIDMAFNDLNSSYATLRWISAFLILGMIIEILIGSFLVTSRPVFFIAHIFITIIAVIVAVPVSNVYETLLSNPTLGSTFQQFTASNFLLAHLPTFVAIIGIIGGVIMVSKLEISDYG